MPSLDDLIARLAGRSCLVTGGAGFIGSHLVDGLVAAGAGPIVVLDDLSLGREENLRDALGHPHMSLHVADVCDAAAVDDRLGGADFDLCFNLAVIPLPHSLEHPRENVDRNVAMTTTICELARAGRVGRLVQFSSSEVFGSALNVPMGEDHPLHPHTPYAAAKAATDLVALSYATSFGCDVVVARPFNTYGERQNDMAYAGLIPVVVRRVPAGEPIVVNGDGEQTRDMAYVSDTVRGALALATAPGVSGRQFNLGHGSELSVNEMVRLLLAAMGEPDHPITWGPERAGDVRRLLADTRAARDAIGYEPQVSVAEGFARTVAWYLQPT